MGTKGVKSESSVPVVLGADMAHNLATTTGAMQVFEKIGGNHIVKRLIPRRNNSYRDGMKDTKKFKDGIRATFSQ